MPGLLDVAPSFATHTINGVEVHVTGVSATGIAVLLDRFPEIRALLTGKAVDMTPEDIVAKVPAAIDAILAAGTGNPGDARAEAVARNLPAGDQLELLKKIIEVTMPKGVGPFADALMGIMGGLGVESLSIPDMKSPQQSNA
ncbi:hypothetical protein JQ608_06655 [Bradyrhizobium liaoningense]|uniref:phage pre-tape measure protein n=1 Tax=Bradyrhizobium liaoningense TaxID=43992 RepID=UPI001BAE1278|nr:hypothetical protein [Bradyrhizobium liaoningense]MBR0876881.1 hypothetical protein [Bradyrhizobium liaoningense]